MKIITSKNIFEEGILVSLRTSLWGATGKLESDKYKVNDENIKEDQIHASFDLLDDKSIIEDMKKIRNQAKHYIQLNSISFTERGLDFVPKTKIEEIDQELQKFQIQFLAMGKDFVSKLKDLEKDFAKNHPKLYRANRYPTEEQLSKMIKFEYVFRAFEPPSEKLLSQKMYKDEIKKFQKDIAGMKESCTSMVQDEIIKRLKALNEQVKDEDKKIHKSTLKAIETMIERFDELWSGFVNNETLKQTIAEIKSAMKGVDIADRKDEEFKKEMSVLIENATKTLKKDKLLRAIDL